MLIVIFLNFVNSKLIREARVGLALQPRQRAAMIFNASVPFLPTTDSSGAGLRSASYTRNFLNEYSQREVPAFLDVLGAAKVNASVTVEGAAAYRRGAYFWKETPLDNSAGAKWEEINVVATQGTNSWSDNRYAFLPQNQEQFMSQSTPNFLRSFL
jgi:hypothetical protein